MRFPVFIILALMMAFAGTQAHAQGAFTETFRKIDQETAQAEEELALAASAARRGDFATAIPLWEDLATREHILGTGYARAQYSLAIVYAEGKGVQQNYTKAAEYFRMAAEGDDPAAQFNLAMMYAEGKGVAQDYTEAAKWARKAATGLAEAKHYLALMYYNGHGVPKDIVKAHMWASLAVAQGDEKAKSAANALTKKLTKDQFDQSHKQAKRCHGSGYKECG